jgi:hypothetical protein
MLKKLTNLLGNIFTVKTQQQLEEEYLSQSIDRYDLEWRQRQLMNRKGYWI